jgi:MscS family membrane protein
VEPSWLSHWISMLPKSYGWLVHIALIFAIAFIFYLVKRIVYTKLNRKIEATPYTWDTALVKASSTPLTLGIWLVAVIASIQVIEVTISEKGALKPIIVFLQLFGVILVTWFLYRFVRLFEIGLLNSKKTYDIMKIDIASKALRIGFFLITALIALGFFGVSPSALITVSGAGAIIVGFASKEALSNFFGGLMIYLDRPFKVGDWIQSPDREIEGTVEQIGLRLTRIRTFDRRPLYIPNSVFSSIALVNPSRMSNRRIKTDIGLRYEDAGKIDKVIQDVEKMLKEHPEIDQRRFLMVHFVEFGEYSLNFNVYTFTKTTDWQKYREVQQDVFLKIIDIIDQNGAEIAYPTRLSLYAKSSSDTK